MNAARARRMVAVAALLALAACGGGSGDGANSSNPGTAPGLTVSPTSLNIIVDGGTPLPAPAQIQITVSDPSAALIVAGYPIGSAVPAWLGLSLDGSGSSWTCSAAVNTTHWSADTWGATIRILIARADQTVIAYRDVPVTYHIAPNVFASPGTLSFSALHGGAAPAAQSVSIDGSAYTTWTVTPSAPWIHVDPASGTVPTTPTIEVSVDPTGLSTGTHTGSVALSGGGKNVQVPVSLEVVNAHRFIVSEDGVAFSSVPDFSRLTRTIRVTDVSGAGAPWLAASDQPWLAVTPTGTAGGDLVLTADPTGLATDALYEANVIVASADGAVENVETVRIGLWVGGTAPVTQIIDLSLVEVAADPVRPLVYVHGGGGTIGIYNVYTGASEGSITGLPSSLGGMAVASDGSTLWVADRTAYQVVPVRLSDRTVGTPWSLATLNTYPRLAYARTDGFPLLVATDGAVHAADDGRVLASFGSFIDSSLVAATSRDGHTACIQSCGSLRYTVLDGGTVAMTPLAGTSGTVDVALVADGSEVLRATPGVYDCPVSSTTTGAELLQLGGQPYPNNVEVGSDGRLYCGAAHVIGTEDVWVYDAAGNAIGTRHLAGYLQDLLDHELVISGDGYRIVGLVPQLVIVSTP